MVLLLAMENNRDSHGECDKNFLDRALAKWAHKKLILYDYK